MFLIILILEIINITSCVHEAQLGPALCDPMDCSLPGSFVHGISQAKHWSELPFLSPEDLPDPDIEPTSPVSPALQEDSLPLESPGN